MVKVLFRRPCHVPPCLINGEGGSITVEGMAQKCNSYRKTTVWQKKKCQLALLI